MNEVSHKAGEALGRLITKEIARRMADAEGLFPPVSVSVDAPDINLESKGIESALHGLSKALDTGPLRKAVEDLGAALRIDLTVENPDVEKLVDAILSKDLDLEPIVRSLHKLTQTVKFMPSPNEAIYHLGKELRKNTLAIDKMEKAYAAPKFVRYDDEGRVISIKTT